MSLTNQELLQELDQRIQAGTIKIDFNNEIAVDPLTTSLFDISVSRGEEVNAESPSWFNRQTLLWLALAVVVFFLVYRKTFTVKSSLSIHDSQSPSFPLASAKTK